MGKVWAVLKNVGSKAKAAGSWVLRRGPLVASLLTGASLVFPQAAGVLKAGAAVVAAQSGGAADQQLVEAIGLAINGALLFIGALRKAWALAKPMLNPVEVPPAPPAGTVRG